MPIYEYECESCKYRFEKLQKVSEEDLKECPKCHKDNLHKLISKTSFKLKGEGWYATDFKDKTNQKKSDTTPKDENKVKSDSKRKNKHNKYY